MIRLGQRLRIGLTVAALIAAVLALGWLSQRYTVETGVARLGELELGETSRRLLTRFEAPVQVSVFLPADSALRAHVKRLLAAYRDAKPDLRFEVVDPQARPELVRELAVTRSGEVVVSYQGRRERAMAPTQARISAALERVLASGERYIGFLTGHGERDLLGLANFDMGQLGRHLQQKGYSIQPLRLDADKPVPDNTHLLVVANPQTPLGADTRHQIASYLASGGALLWLTEPGTEAELGLLTPRLGLRRRPGVIVDPAANEMLAAEDPRLVLVPPQRQHEAVSTGDAPVLLSRSAELVLNVEPGWTPVKLLRAGEQARLAGLPWSDQAGAEEAEPAPAALLGVGLTRGAEAAEATREQRVAVIGDGDFLSNRYLGNAGNLPFGLNLVRWLMAEDTLLATYQPARPDQRLNLSRISQTVIGLGFLLVLPGVLAALAVYRWWRLRRG